MICAGFAPTAATAASCLGAAASPLVSVLPVVCGANLSVLLLLLLLLLLLGYR
jgi:hypothetical protein